MIDQLRAKPDLWKFVKFLIVGVMNTAFGVVVYEILVVAGMAPQRALALAYFIGICWNYFTHGKLVFKTHGFGRFPAYLGSYFIIYLANSLGLKLMLDQGVSKFVAQPILAVFMAIPTFFLISFVLTGRVPLFGAK